MMILIELLLALWLAFVGGLGSSVDAGLKDGLLPTRIPAFQVGSSPRLSSILPSAPTPRPTGHILRPILEAHGWATYQPGTGDWASPGSIVGSWHVSSVRVCAGSRCIVVRLPAHNPCACGFRKGLPTLLDLSESARESSKWRWR